MNLDEIGQMTTDQLKEENARLQKEFMKNRYDKPRKSKRIIEQREMVRDELYKRWHAKNLQESRGQKDKNFYGPQIKFASKKN